MLVFLSNLIRGCARGEDYAVRMGGDEFAVFLPSCTIERAGEFAHRLLSLFHQRASGGPSASGKQTGLSIGIASLNRDQVRNGRELLDRADERLYAAKRAGKNQIVG
jgi:diguanylate cyclase (GGDEF)-like protein